MKTNNIFRTLFMAVLLLVGASSAKADETTIWTGPNDGIFSIDGDSFSSVTAGSKVRFYISSLNIYYWDFRMNSGGQAEGKLWTNWEGKDWGNGAQTSDAHNSTHNDTYIELEVSQNGAVQLKANGLTFTEVNGVVFDKITIVSGSDDSGSDEPATPQTYTITVSTDIANGSITANPTSAKAGETVTLTITPNNGYELDWVSVKDAKNNSVTLNNNNQFTMPASNVTISGGFKAIQTVEAKISSSTGYATFCSKEALDFSGVSGLVAYYAKSVVNDSSVILVPVSGTVAARTGLVIKGSKGSTTKIPIVTTGTPIEGNLLVGVLSQVVVNEANEYVLTEEGGQAKFVTTEFTGASLNAGHAYLRIPSSSGYSRLAVVFAGETTGIEDRTLVGQEENVYYDLRGVRVAKPTHGIYVVNGKKVFVK